MKLMKNEPKPRKRHLDDRSDYANDESQKCRKMGQEDSKKHYHSGSRQTAGKVKYWDPTASSVNGMKGFSRKAKVTTTVIRKKPLEHTELKNIKPTGSRCNERSFGSKDGCFQKPKVTTTVVSPKKPVKVVDSNLGKDKPVDFKSFKNNENKSITAVISRNKPLMRSVDNVGSSHRNMSSDGKKNLAETNKRLERFVPKESGRNKTFSGSRPAGKVKFYDPTCPEEDDHVKKPEKKSAVVLQKEKAEREKIKIAMARFEQVYNKLSEDNRKRPTVEKTAPLQLTVDASRKVKRELKLMDAEKKIGSICGVQVGDRFKFRAQLQMVDLHSQLHRGIDYIKGMNLATSIVDSHRYSNVSGYSDRLIYCGHGGTNLYGPKTSPVDQKLKQGNLALKNSMVENSPVRVIRKVQGVERQEFVYDGLYMVKHYKEGKSEDGKLVFKFELERVPGQPSLHEMFNGNWQLH